MTAWLGRLLWAATGALVVLIVQSPVLLVPIALGAPVVFVTVWIGLGMWEASKRVCEKS